MIDHDCGHYNGNDVDEACRLKRIQLGIMGFAIRFTHRVER